MAIAITLAEDPALVSTLNDGALPVPADVVDGAGNTIAIDTGEPALAITQAIGFNVNFNVGGVL